MSDANRYATCDDGNGHWGIEDIDCKVIVSGLVSHDACDTVIDLLDNRDAEIARLKAEVDRLKKYNEEAMAHIAKEERKSRERLDMVQAEVERLTKAANWVLLQWDANNDGQETSRVGSNSIKELRNAAKNGGQS